MRTRALQAGSGEPVIFLHGTSGHLEAFIRNIPAHSAEYACHAIDMLGHGYTDGPDEPYRIPVYVEHVLDYMDASASTGPTSSASRSAAGSPAGSPPTTPTASGASPWSPRAAPSPTRPSWNGSRPAPGPRSGPTTSS